MKFPPQPPVLTTPRLRLRPFVPADAAAVRALAGERLVAATTALLPHPYPEGAAEAWIGTHADSWAAQAEAVFAITRLGGGELLGAIGLTVNPRHDSADLGYWIGLPFWNQGFATEAARAVIDCGFRTLGLNRISAHYMATNAASGRVMAKAGMTREGCSPQAIRKDGRFHDAVFYGVVRSDWPDLPAPAPVPRGLSANDLA